MRVEVADDADKMGPMMMVGVALLFVSLSFDGATGAYEDMIMSTAHVGPFELMYNIQLGKCILAGLGLIFLNEACLARARAPSRHRSKSRL